MTTLSDDTSIELLQAEIERILKCRELEAVSYLESVYGENALENLCEALKVSVDEGYLFVFPKVFKKKSLISGLQLSDLEIENRRKFLGSNEIRQFSFPSLFSHILNASKSIALVILLIAIILSSVISIFDSVSTPNGHRRRVEIWIETCVIIFIVILMVLFNAVARHFKDKRFRELHNLIHANQRTRVVRNGKVHSILVKDLVVGDVCILNIGNYFVRYKVSGHLYICLGDIIPADGLVITSCDLKCDEGLLTGRSELVEKSMLCDPVLISGCLQLKINFLSVEKRVVRRTILVHANVPKCFGKQAMLRLHILRCYEHFLQ